MPVLIGWSAVTNSLTWTPVLLFLVIFIWTPPHFWALAMKFRDDYAAASVPMLPVVASAATVIAGVTGVASGYMLAKGHFPGRDVLETVGSLPIILPPTVIGYYLLEVLSPGTQVGGFLTRVTGHVFVYNVWGCIIAAAVAAYPFCLRAARSAIAGVDPALEQAARTMGLPNWRVALQVTLPLARRGTAAGLTIGCARALGEYGATLMIGGDINGRTRTMSLAILDSFTTPERDTMLLILVLMAIIAMTGVGLLGRSRS